MPRVKRLPSRHAFPGLLFPVVDRREDEICADSDKKKFSSECTIIADGLVGVKKGKNGARGESKGCPKQG
jgi:hypothetical protein